MANKLTTLSKNFLIFYHRLDSIGGIETRWIDEFKYLKNNGYKIYLAIPEVMYKSQIGKKLNPDEIILLENNKFSNAANFTSLIDEMVQIIKSKHIDIVSIHMQDLFTLAAIIASQLTQIPVISTVHGILDIYRPPLHRLLIQNLASKSHSLSISVSRTLYKLQETNCTNNNIIIPNLIDLKKYNKSKPQNNKWLIVSRLSPEKYPAILRFLEAADNCNITEVDIAGGGNEHELLKLINSKKLETKVSFLGEVKAIENLIPSYKGVSGVGRVALEGLASKKPVCICSPQGQLHGLVTKANYETLSKYNFNGNGLAPISNKELMVQLQEYKSSDSEEIHDRLSNDFNVEQWDTYIKSYDQLVFKDNPPLEALYFKISHFSRSLQSPFLKDELFQHLFYETLIEYKLEDIRELWHHYESSIGLITKYPNPYDNKEKKSFKWLK